MKSIHVSSGKVFRGPCYLHWPAFAAVAAERGGLVRVDIESERLKQESEDSRQWHGQSTPQQLVTRRACRVVATSPFMYISPDLIHLKGVMIFSRF